MNGKKSKKLDRNDKISNSSFGPPYNSIRKKIVLYYIGGVQLIPWDSNDKEIFAMLDENILADKEKPLFNSTKMAAMT